ncbi:hypothetical protein [Pseudomonas protegens]|uniref:hypothetical protein n=1 Tax=Pseudomonas protegens TaxID=380021 RepID=UPI00391A75D4
MNQYMPITGHDCNIPSLLIDTQAPIDVLHDAAAYRIRAVTQLLENFAVSDEAPKGAVVLQELSLVCSICMRSINPTCPVVEQRSTVASAASSSTAVAPRSP